MKPKSKKALIIASIIVLVVAVIGFAIWQNNKKKKAAKSGYTSDGSPVAAEPVTSQNLNPAFFPLKKGSEGDLVVILQKWLLQNGGTLPNYGADGDFGTETETALVSVLGVDQISYEYFKNNIL